ncbi:dynein-related subfamily AAA family protein [Stackebrandtia endophytica]|uniref:Dynein-related subfamily AAA family protein n=1 Tax=Stackebrandtia endophytica TaxID=1496996 RepID=A0A543AY81_9ACTN|nr:DNA repair ATPase [Stackebrandtia endophytica]TQL77534.1 dynein-related subfamily AAA family protein [Stackebrandtia endophytica]
MSEQETVTTEESLDAGTYEVLRTRLAQQADELTRRAETLNSQRLEVFGGTEMSLLGTDRIRTENNCVPRDIVQVGGQMLFGYNVYIGLKPNTDVSDVFALHSFGRDGDAFSFSPASDDKFLGDPSFRNDFAELYRYYRQAQLLQLRRLPGRLLAVFQIGEKTEDIRVLRWEVAADGTATYLDSRGERDHVFPAQHDFEWTPTTREDHVGGKHPHVSIEGEVFVECVSGDLTVKIEDNTSTGEGIYSEPVTEKLQSLADADISYARVGPLILLKILPYNETQWRYLVFNTRTKTVTRADGIGEACQSLPEEQGIIFPGGYYLSTGAHKTFDTDVTGLEFERVVRSPNGEDVLYVFHARADGRTLLLPYNVIRKEISNPLPCHGFSIFDDGTMVAFRASSDEPTRVHPMQVWQTPFVSDTFDAAQPVGDSPMERLGNSELVRGISDALSVSRMVADMAPSTEVFEALIAACTRAFDAYHWLTDSELGDLAEPLGQVRDTAQSVLEEYETVAALREQASAALATAQTEITRIIRRSSGEAPKSADAWVSQLAELRATQGRLVTLSDMRYIDSDGVKALGEAVSDELVSAGRRAVAFLQRDEAFSSYHEKIEALAREAGEIESTVQSGPLVDRLSEQNDGLGVLTEVVSNLDIDDVTIRTAILEKIAEVLAGVNRARAILESRRRELLDSEGRAEFGAEFALLGQAITAGLAAATSPTACDEQLGKLMLTLENLESRFSEFDDFLSQLTDKRTDVYEAFATRKQALLDERARRGERLSSSADRILAGVTRRTATLDSVDAVNTYFATDPMVTKLRDIAEELRDLGDQVRAEELLGRIKAARQEAGRSLRDRQDLYDGDTINLGGHRLPVNTQPMELTLVPSGDRLAFSLSGTDYRSVIDDPEFADTKPFWTQLVVSETAEVYRSEHLAASILAEKDIQKLRQDALSEEDLVATVRTFAESRFDEGYERGVHDHDAAQILHGLLRLEAGAGLLRFPPGDRAAAALYWGYGVAEADRPIWLARAASLAAARKAFGRTAAVEGLCTELAEAITAFHESATLPGEFDAVLAGQYLFEELATGGSSFASGDPARSMVKRFRSSLGRDGASEYSRHLKALGTGVESLRTRRELVSAWLTAFLSGRDDAADLTADLPEAITIELLGDRVEFRETSADLSTTVDGLLGTHPRISGRRMRIRLDELLARTAAFRRDRIPAFRNFLRRRNALVEQEKNRLRVEEYQPKVMSSFVRNRLLDEVYLPLIGSNLAKQLGAAGDAKRTDQSGMLLLISPPGYGKTTLMEYVASRLGMVFVKVNGPSLGHEVTSLDPSEAPNATARQEVEKISFALEAGNNVMLYLDDIQHTNPELLQKFISLCDGQRRMEGVWQGRTRTYDLRGKRFAVVMAGNPYTESGKRFRIPDMLANRADVWNLGDVLSGREEVFALSYLENSLTSNPVLAQLTGRDRGDLELLVRLARNDSSANPEQLSYSYPAAELEQILSVLRKLLRVQEIVLRNNQAYIASAAQADSSRTEPPFGLQGSYRNMNKLAERIVPVMNEDELEAVIDDHYLGEAQTLTSGAEANLLKLAELRGRMSAEQSERWTAIKAAFVREQALGGDGEDPASRAVGALSLLADAIGGVESAIAKATDPRATARATAKVYGKNE